MKTLTTMDEVLDALGGAVAVSDMFGITIQAVSNWKCRKPWKFPPETHHALTAELNRLGFTAPASLWRQKEPIQTREVA